MISFLDKVGIIHQTTCSGTPKKNGVTKRKNKHLLEIAQAILLTMNVPRTFWFKAIQIVVYLMNRMSSHSLAFKLSLEVLSPTTPLFSSSSKDF